MIIYLYSKTVVSMINKLGIDSNVEIQKVLKDKYG